MAKFVKYHKDGSLWAKGNKVGGVLDGFWEWFRKDGTKMRSGYFKKGKQVGKWTTFDKSGKVYKVASFDKKNFVSRQFFCSSLSDKIKVCKR